MSAPPLPHGAKVVVVSGPGGVGKGTLVELLLDRDPHLWLRLVYGSAPIEHGPSYFQVAVLTSNVQRGPTSLLPARVPNHAKQKS